MVVRPFPPLPRAETSRVSKIKRRCAESQRAVKMVKRVDTAQDVPPRSGKTRDVGLRVSHLFPKWMFCLECLPAVTIDQQSRPSINMSRTKYMDQVLAKHLDRRESRSLLRSLTLVPPGMVDFSSNSYLSLSAQPSVKASFLARLQAAAASDPYTPLLGSGGSRLLDGNSTRAEFLEKTLAAFHNAPASLLFNSAMDANIGLLSCVPQPGDVIVYDELAHASIHDGMRQSRADQRIPFAHNSIWPKSVVASSGSRQELDPLQDVLVRVLQAENGHFFRSGQRNVFVVVEGVYSMDGDTAPLKDVVQCVERCLPAGNGLVIVDEAHSVGVFGEKGRGLVCELALEDRVWARVLGFGKAMGCSGGMCSVFVCCLHVVAHLTLPGLVLCSDVTRSYLINYARTLIYTTAMALPSLISIQVAYGFMMQGRVEPLLQHLTRLVKQAHVLLLGICERRNPPRNILHINSLAPKSSIIPVLTDQPRSLARHCQDKGFMVRPIVAPTVSTGTERIRICLHAANTSEQIAGLVAAIEDWVVSRMLEKENAISKPRI